MKSCCEEAGLRGLARHRLSYLLYAVLAATLGFVRRQQ